MGSYTDQSGKRRWSACSVVLLLLVVGSAGVLSLPAPNVQLDESEPSAFVRRNSRAQHTTWDYVGVSHWGVSFPVCSGQHQSPIDLASSKTVYDSTLQDFVFEPVVNTHTWTIQNNGHSVTVIADGLLVSGGSLGSTYRVAQFHWHWGSDDTHGSEHTVDGKAFPMELHVVCFNLKYNDFASAVGNADGLAVLGFFYEVQHADNPQLNDITAALSHVVTAGASSSEIHKMDITRLMPITSYYYYYYRYQGSLTTPGCDEVVTWSIFAHTIPISHSQLAAFRRLRDAQGAPLVNNYRAVQNLNDRIIKCNFVRTVVG